MKYILLMYCDESLFVGDELAQARDESVEICRELHERGQYVDAAPLEPMEFTRSVQVRAGQSAVVDGPFAETKEQLGGYIVVDVDTMDEAVAIAARFPSARKGTIQVRPLVILENLPR